METIELRLDGSRTYRPTEIVADLRNVVEALFHPMRMVGYWDTRSSDHLCLQDKLGQPCPHVLPKDDPRHVDYQRTVERDLDAVLHVDFPHAQVHFYLS